MASADRPSFFGREDNPFGTLLREVQKTFEDFSRRTPFARFTSDILSPKIDVAESKDAIEVTAELPGVDEKDVDVTLANGMLTIRGEKKTERIQELLDLWIETSESLLLNVPADGAASGHAAVAPPRMVMKSRRLK